MLGTNQCSRNLDRCQANSFCGVHDVVHRRTRLACNAARWDLNTAYNYLDLLPKGRDEQGRGQSWVRRHDEYGR